MAVGRAGRSGPASAPSLGKSRGVVSGEGTTGVARSAAARLFKTDGFMAIERVGWTGPDSTASLGRSCGVAKGAGTIGVVRVEDARVFATGARICKEGRGLTSCGLSAAGSGPALADCTIFGTGISGTSTLGFLIAGCKIV